MSFCWLRNGHALINLDGSSPEWRRARIRWPEICQIKFAGFLCLILEAWISIMASHKIALEKLAFF